MDGDLTSFIAVNNPVDTSKPGTYTITYNVTDKADNAAAEVSRMVQVVNAAPPSLSIQRNAMEPSRSRLMATCKPLRRSTARGKGSRDRAEVALSTDEAQQFFRATR